MTFPPVTRLPHLTAKHVRAGRALLAWSQRDLAIAANLANLTVADFERGQRSPIVDSIEAIRRALEGAGIQFLPTGAIVGPTPSITRSVRPGLSIRWITAEDLAHWASRIDGSGSLPTLLAHLIHATHGPAVRLHFPADEGVRYPGWDGSTFTDVGSTYVPEGDAGWEVTAQRDEISRKASDDYEKRTRSPEPFDPADATYVFVTLRRWPGKDKWAKARQDKGPWKRVLVHDADDLVHWIEQNPAVGLWLATRLGKRPPGTRELEECWEEWSRASRQPLTEALVLSDRDQDATEVLRWLRDEPSVLSLRATTTDEVVAFFHATLRELPDDQAAGYRASCLVVTADAARILANAPAPLILLLTEAESGLAQRLSDLGHYVLQAYDERPMSRGEVRTLARPSREGIADALTAAGMAEASAKAFARDSARNLVILRRLLPGAPAHLPIWMEGPPPPALLAALLVGGWNEAADADKVRLSELARMPYDAVAAALAPYVGQIDSPLQKVGSTWRISSPIDAWFLLARNLTEADIARFEAVAHAVLESADPRFDLEPDERWLAAVRGIRRDHSGMMRHGIGQVLILLALRSDQVHLVPDAGRRVDAIVGRLLRNADRRRWWSLAHDFRLLAEASPNAFLAALEDSLDQNDPPVGVLFGHDGGGVFGTEYLSDLMWALEALAWLPEWMPRITHLLARLDAIDTKPRSYSNGPARSLRGIHLLWSPQTHATLDERLRALDRIRMREPDAAWKLLLAILPRDFDTSTPASVMRWRDSVVGEVEVVNQALLARGEVAISERLLEDVGLTSARWSSVLDRLRDLVPGPEGALSALERAEPRITGKAERTIFWNKLRAVLHHHRAFPDAQWSLKDGVLDHLEAIYDRFAPADSLERIAWLFRQPVQLPRPPGGGWQAEHREVEAIRLQAAKTLHAAGGIPAVLSLARLSDTPSYLGQALHDGGLSKADSSMLIETAVRSDEIRERDMAHGMIALCFRSHGGHWAEDLIATAQRAGWGDTAILTILRALPSERWAWDQVARIEGDMEDDYWRRTPIPWTVHDADDLAHAVRMLIRVGRARHALALVAQDAKARLPTKLIVDLLGEAGRQPDEAEVDGNDATMFQYHVTEALKLLDERDDVDKGILALLEWKYLQVLEHSGRPMKVLLRELSEQPSLFIDMVRLIYKPDEGSDVADTGTQDPEHARSVATQAHRLLELWNQIPGTRDDGTIDGGALESWIREARTLAKAAGRSDFADDRIGKMLSASPVGKDGAWPAEPVREVIDLFRSRWMLEGFHIGRGNRRGMTTRMPRDGGKLERREAGQYRAWSSKVAPDHPYTARALDILVDKYEREARWHDEAVERLDWAP